MELPIDLPGILATAGDRWNRGDVVGALRMVHMYFSVTVNDAGEQYREVIKAHDLNTRAVHMLKRCIDYVDVARTRI